MKVTTSDNSVYSSDKYFVLRQYTNFVVFYSVLSDELFGTVVKVSDSEIEVCETNTAFRILYQKDSLEARK
jgi:hypothetical protein